MSDAQYFAFEFFCRDKSFPGSHLQVWDYNITQSQANNLRDNLMLIESKLRQLEVEAINDNGNRT